MSGFHLPTKMLLFVASLLLLPVNADHSACGGTFIAPRGTIQSPGYPGNYGNSLDCVYIIRQPPAQRITVTFEAFDLEGANGCAADFLEIRDGDSARSPLISRLCGSDLPSPKRSFQNTMYIRFRSDSSVTGTGFRFSYTSGVEEDSFFLVTSSRGIIFRMDLETSSNIVIPGLRTMNPIGVDFDPVERRVYWTDVTLKTISSANLDGTDQKLLRQLNQSAIPDGIAVDPVSRLVFYTDTGNDVIAVMTMSGSMHRTLISTDLSQPRAIELDTLNGVMYWSDWGFSPKIERANYDGSDRRTIVTGFLIAPNALAIDHENDRLYWVDAGTDWVEYSDFDGNGRGVLYTSNRTHFFGLAYYDDHLYATDWTAAGSRTRVSYIIKLGTKQELVKVIGSAPIRMNDIHLHAPDNWERGPNGCSHNIHNNRGCEYICVPTSRYSSKCLCPDAPTACVEQ